MAKKLDPKGLVTIEELAISNLWENAALVELFGTQRRPHQAGSAGHDPRELRQREPTAIPPRRLSS